MEKEERIFIRISKYQKENWKKICLEKQTSLTRLITNSVENRIFDGERRKILRFIENQDNIFTKIETNINQVAKIANTQKLIRDEVMENFREQLQIILELKKQQNEIFIKIYSLIARKT